MNKRGLSDVVTTVLILLLALAAVVIIWAFISNVLQKGGGGISDSSELASVSYSISNVIVSPSLSVLVKRESGGGDAEVFPVIVVEGTNGKTKSFSQESQGNIPELATQSFSLDLAGTGISEVKKISIYAGIRNADGKLITSPNPTDVYSVLSGFVVTCTQDSDCYDALFCNGDDTETCVSGACVAGTNPCTGAGELCYGEPYNTCIVCGDGITDSPMEECDGEVGCSATCRFEGGENRAFVASTTYPANQFANNLGNADSACETQAAVAGLGNPGKWKAWISNSTEDVSARLAHSIRYKLVDDTIIASNWGDLIDSSLDSPIDKTESGSDLSGVLVWTGTRSNGGPSGSNCNDWTSSNSADTGMAGDSSLSDYGWTALGTSACDLRGHLYCIEQP